MHEDDESVPCLWVFKGTSVWHMAEGGEMSGGTLQLGGGGVVALDRSCTDFHLSDVYLNGAEPSLSGSLLVGGQSWRCCCGVW